MLVAQLIAPRQFQLVDAKDEAPGPGEVRVRVHAVGICGSDLHSYSEGAVGDSPCQYPMVLGHEPAGVVEGAGPGVTGWRPGDRVALEPAVYCYHCEYCRSGLYNLCENIRFLSTPGIPGFFREFVNLPASNLLALPRELPLDMATLFEPLAVAAHSLRFASMRLGESAAVFGAGPIGLLTIACLRAAGAGRIWAVEPVAHRRALAKFMGAVEAIDPRQMDPVRELRSATNGRGVDCAIDCAARDESTNWAIQAACNGGRVVITGIHSGVKVPFEVCPMRRKELAIFSVRRSNHESETALEMLAERPGLFAPLVTHRRPLERIAEAFQLAEAYADGVGKLVIE